MATNWQSIHFILNEDGNVIGDFKEGSTPYGFLRNRKAFSVDEATKEEREILVNLVYLFFTMGDTEYHNQYEYVELEGYMMYRKVDHVTLYSDLFFTSDPLDDGEFMYLSVMDELDEHYIMTTDDVGFAHAVVNHFQKDYGIVVHMERIEAYEEPTLDYWKKNTTKMS